MEHLDNVAIRYIEASNKGQITYTDELNILEHILNKFKPKSVSEYAKKQNISTPAVYDRIKRGKVMYVEIINRKFIFE